MIFPLEVQGLKLLQKARVDQRQFDMPMSGLKVNTNITGDFETAPFQDMQGRFTGAGWTMEDFKHQHMQSRGRHTDDCVFTCY